MTDLEQIRALAAQGIGLFGVEATIGRKMSHDELTAFRKAATVRKLRLAQRKAQGPKSVAERVRDHVARTNEIPDFDARPRHPRLKAACRFDLEKFMWFYCRRVLNHRPPKHIRDGLIHDVQETILHGGQAVKQYGRGTGKTTIIVYCAITWAILYGHRRYPVIISATAKLAKKNLKVIKKLLARTPAIAQDFPAVAVPIQALGDVSQRAASQTYHGAATDVEWAADQIVLPMCRDERGRPLDSGCGAIVGSVGIGGAVRGSNEGGQRPDFLILDDPQTEKIAHSPAMVQSVIDYIHHDALMLAGHDRAISAFVTITPQCFGDVATELCSRSKHPEWDVSIEPFVVRKCPDWSRLVTAFVEQYVADAVAHDSRRTRSTEWYRANRDKFVEVEVLDPLQYDKSAELDAVHHVLNLRARLGAVAFDAEIMMAVSDAASELEVNADMVAAKLNGAPPNVLPPGTDQVVVFCDVNITRDRGLSWAAVAFGPHRVAAVVNYGRYPRQGPLVPPNSSDLVRNRLVASGIRAVVEQVAAIPFRDAKGRRVQPIAFGFDRGYLPAVIHRALYVLRKTRPLPFPLVAVRGFPWDKFGVRDKDLLRRGDHVFATRSQYGQYLAEMAPYWREIMQSGFLETPLMAGSISLFGTDPTRHFEFATEVCNEKLVRKYAVTRGRQTLTAWDWQTMGDNHYCDCLTGCFALASWYHAYDNLSQVIDGVIVSPSGRTFKAATPSAQPNGDEIAPHRLHQDDLFDPMRNKALVSSAGYAPSPSSPSSPDGQPAPSPDGQSPTGHPPAPASPYDGAADETEGTLDADVAPFAGDIEATANPLVDANPVPPQPRGARVAKKRLYKFRRGRYVK